jgi:DNA-binding CsgD family transcriptional regulator
VNAWGWAALAGVALAAVAVSRRRNPSGIYWRPQRIAPRERQLLELYRRGHTDQECARQMGISPYTVRDVKRRLFTKLGAESKAEIVRNAMRRGLLT